MPEKELPKLKSVLRRKKRGELLTRREKKVLPKKKRQFSRLRKRFTKCVRNSTGTRKSGAASWHGRKSPLSKKKKILTEKWILSKKKN